MKKNNQSLKSYVIIGGGTAGWISASILAHVLQNTDVSITVIESPDIPTIGVGEATIPSFVDLLTFLGISQQDFIIKTKATFKLGIKFIDWSLQGEHYWHPFGVIGSKIDGKDFYQHWLKANLNGAVNDFTNFSPAIAMAKEHRFHIPDPKKRSNLSNSAYALHFDASTAAEYLAEYAMSKGVKRIKDHVEQVSQYPDGRIKSVFLRKQESISGDFFIDCSGQSALLIKKALRVGRVDWQHYLPVNRAVAMQTEKIQSLPSYTESIAHKNGWQWRIPLQNRTGNGFVYCSDYCDDQQATDFLTNQIQGKIITDPRTIKFTTGKTDKFWHQNCLAVGLSAGFLEPLESTGIYLIMRSMLNFVKMLPNAQLAEITQREYNRLMDEEYENIRDFIVLHYCVSKRSDSDFWRMWQHNPIPQSLENKLELFKSQGRLYQNKVDLFASDSWYAVLEGMKVTPEAYDPTVDASNFEQIEKILAQSESALSASVKKLLTHQEYIDRLTTFNR